MDTFDTLFDLMTSEALQGAVDVSSSSSTLLDSSTSGKWTDTTEQSQARGAFLANATVGVKPVRSPEALRLVVDLLGHCEGKPELQARVMEALVDALDGSPAGIQVRGVLVSGGRGCTHAMHGRSHVTIDPRIPTMLGRSTSGFHRPGRHCLGGGGCWWYALSPK